MLELQNISFGVSESQGKKEILKDISLTVGENKFVVITGPNGGGKSTLAKMIMGIEKPRSGKILFDGQDITEKTITEPTWGSALPFSSRCASRGSMCWI